jgi:hypothetical protein
VTARTTASAASVVVAALALLGPAPAGAQSDPVVYVALGDSYTSGPLVLPHDETWVPEDCGQSTQNYPHLAAAELGVDEFVDVSCGGANIDDFYEPQDGLTLGGTNAPQFDALDSDVDIVTVGIGGNDVGFVGLAEGCLRFLGPPSEQPCSPAYTAGGVDKVSLGIAAMGVELAQALQDIHTVAPGAAVFVVSYPDALPDDGVACWPYLPILQADMPYLVAKFKEMNATLASTAAANGATYIDIYTTSIGHDACQPPALAWVNGAVLVPPSFPAHPNLLSFLSSGPVVAAAIRAQQAGPSGPSGPSEPAGPAGATTTTPTTVQSVTATTTATGSRGGAALARTGGGAWPTVGLVLLATGVTARRRRAPARESPTRRPST